MIRFVKTVLLIALLNIGCNNSIKKEDKEVISIDTLIKIENNDSRDKAVTIKKDSFVPDIKINNLELSNSESIINSIKNFKELIVEDENLPHVSLTDKNRKILLKAIMFPGSSSYDVYQFDIEYLSKTTSEKVELTSFNDFITESNLMLGITKDKVIAIKGKSYNLKKKDDKVEIISYRIDDYNTSSFLQKYNLPGYFMEFFIKDNIVIKMKFGFDYP